MWTDGRSASPGSERPHSKQIKKKKKNQMNVLFRFSQIFQKMSVKTDLSPEETIAFLLHIVVDDARHFLLPDFKAIYADVVLDVLK